MPMNDFPTSAHDALSWFLPSVHGERYALASCHGGSVLLDLESGTFYRLNPVATAICRGLTREEPVADVARGLAASYRIPLAQAVRDVESVLARLRQTPAVQGTNPIRFEADSDGLLMRWQGRDVCHFDLRDGVLTHRATGGELPEPVLQLLWAAPHVLVLRGQPVLHASAVRHGDGVLAFCGPSGVGKTTLARLFAERGLPLVAEDLVLLALDGAVPEVILDGERAVREWANRHAPLLAAGGPIRTDDLVRASDGPRASLREVWLLGRSGGTEPVIRREPLEGAEALVLLLRNSFAESGQRAVWRELLWANRRVVNTTPARQAWCPEGLEVLRAGVAAYR